MPFLQKPFALSSSKGSAERSEATSPGSSPGSAEGFDKLSPNGDFFEACVMGQNDEVLS
jgi:hypothetical protein